MLFLIGGLKFFASIVFLVLDGKMLVNYIYQVLLN